MLDKTKLLISWTIILLSTAILLIFPVECRNGGTNGVFLCLQVLIPSLFPFMVISSFVIKSGLVNVYPKWTDKITRALFALPGHCIWVIILAMIGGYPIGASGIKALYEQEYISKSDAKRMSLFCVASGPGFLVTYIGAVMTRSLKLGYILLISQAISVMLLGILSKFISRSKYSKPYKNISPQKTANNQALVVSVFAAIKSCAQMCALVVLFSTLCEVFLSLTADNTTVQWIVAFVEITNGTKILCNGYPAVLISAVCGFGGLCVHFQIFSLLQNIGIPKRQFYLFRVLQSIICASITYILLKIFPVYQEVFSTVENADTTLNNTVAGCVVLIACCCAFLVSVKNIKSSIRY